MTPHPHPHPWSHLYFCAFLHRHVCLNADGIKRLLLPQSISVFLFYLLLLISRVCGMHWLQTNQSPVGDLHHDPCMEFIGSILRASPPMSLLTGWPCVLHIICLCADVFVLSVLSVWCLADVVSCIFAQCSVKLLNTFELMGIPQKGKWNIYVMNRGYNGITWWNLKSCGNSNVLGKACHDIMINAKKNFFSFLNGA